MFMIIFFFFFIIFEEVMRTHECVLSMTL